MDEAKKHALSMIYESIKDRTELTKDQYESLLHGWDVLPLLENDKIIGGVLVKGNEIHVGYGIKPKSSIRKYIKNILNNLIDRYGCVVTSVLNSNLKGLKFCKRLGFFETTTDGSIVKLCCYRSNYK